MPKKPPKPVRQFHGGDKLKVNLHLGRIVDATDKAVVNDEKGRLRLQGDFGKNATEAALIYDWQMSG